MSGPHVVIEHAGRRTPLRPGSFIGRLASSSLRIQDPRVSEAHALVTLRGRELMLLALRGGLQVNGVVEDAVVLESGQQLSFAPGVEAQVLEVALPTQVLVLLADGADPLEPCAAVHALLPSRHWVPTWRPEALVHVWPTDAEWMIQVQGRAERVVAGASWVVGGITLRAAWVPLEQLASERTALAGTSEPVEVVGRSDTAELPPPRPRAGHPEWAPSEAGDGARPARAADRLGGRSR